MAFQFLSPPVSYASYDMLQMMRPDDFSTLRLQLSIQADIRAQTFVPVPLNIPDL